MKNQKKPAPTRNWVAKNDFNVGGAHLSKKDKANLPHRKRKHKGESYDSN